MSPVSSPFAKDENQTGNQTSERKVSEKDKPLIKNEYACTVISLLPFEIREDKPHMLPSTFVIPAMVNGMPGILHVKEGIHYVPNPLIDEGKPGSTIKQMTPPTEMARSICEDYCSAHVCLDDDAKPGLFWVEGKVQFDYIRNYHHEQLTEAVRMQKNWFNNLCMMADADWQKNHNMLAVSDLQRAAAKALNIQREWVEFRMQEMTNCPFCQVAIHPEAVICSSCKQIVNKAKFDAMGGKVNAV